MAAPFEADLIVDTEDGSRTVRHPRLGETYHARQGAASEAEAKFIRPSGLRERLQRGPLRLLDVGLGLGINCRAALACAGAFPLVIDTLECEAEALERGLMICPGDPLLSALQTRGVYQGVTLHLGDLRQTLPSLPGPYDLIFHDPFSPLKNTEAWTVEVFRLLRDISAPDALLATYSESTVVRSALHEAGWHVGASAAMPPHRGGSLAARRMQDLQFPLDPADFLSEPYRDPGLDATAREIRARRERAVRASRV